MYVGCACSLANTEKLAMCAVCVFQVRGAEHNFAEKLQSQLILLRAALAADSMASSQAAGVSLLTGPQLPSTAAAAAPAAARTKASLMRRHQGSSR